MYTQRVQKLRAYLKERGCAGFLISNYYSILYLTGFKTLNPYEKESFFLVTQNDLYFLTDSRYVDSTLHEMCRKQGILFRLLEQVKGLLYHLKEIIMDEKISIMGFEENSLTQAEYQMFVEKLDRQQLIPMGSTILHLRTLKDESEIEVISQACQVGDLCLAELIDTFHVGMTERQAALKLEMIIREKGYEIAFDPIVAIDESSSVPHYSSKTGKREVAYNSIILIDFGVRVQDYCSDMTRMVSIGKPTTEFYNCYIKLLDVQEKTITHSSKADTYAQIDSFCREQLGEVSSAFTHSTGHGVGLEVHESPHVSMTSIDKVHDGHIFTVEPGLYYPGKWGIRIEDTVCFQKGQVRTLTHFPKDLLIVEG